MSNISERKLVEFLKYYKSHTPEETLAAFNISSATVSRYLRKAEQLGMELTGKPIYKKQVLDEIAERSQTSQGELDLYLWYLETKKILK